MENAARAILSRLCKAPCSKTRSRSYLTPHQHNDMMKSKEMFCGKHLSPVHKHARREVFDRIDLPSIAQINKSAPPSRGAAPPGHAGRKDKVLPRSR